MRLTLGLLYILLLASSLPCIILYLSISDRGFQIAVCCGFFFFSPKNICSTMSAGGIIEGNSSNSASKCASCRHQRRRCPNDCIFRPYFPLRKREEFESARRVFGVSNMERMLRILEVQDREKAVESMIWEASCWSKDSINGPLG